MECMVFTRAQAAEQLGCSVWSIDKFVDTGELRAIYVGAGSIRKHIRIPKHEVERLLKGEERRR